MTARELRDAIRLTAVALAAEPEPASSTTNEAHWEPLAWHPRDIAERLARRARLSGRQREGSPSGGQAVLRRYGARFYSAIGARGGETVVEERGIDYMQDIGRRGGAATRQRYGPEHYAEIGRKGGQAGRGRKRPRKRPNQPELPLDA